MRTIHCCLSVRGALRWNKRMLKGMAPYFHVEGRAIRTGDDVREFLLDCLSEGKEVIPMGTPCEGFDFKKGCPGHEQPDEVTP